MASENVTFSIPDFGNEEHEEGISRISVNGHDDVISRTPGFDVDRRQSVSSTGLNKESTSPRLNASAGQIAKNGPDDASCPPAKSAAKDKGESNQVLEASRVAQDTQVIQDREHDRVRGVIESDEKLDPAGKQDMLAPTQSLALAATESNIEGQVHKVVKKKTYLHRTSKMYRESIQKHTLLAKTLAVMQNIWTMGSTFPYWDMAFWSG